LGTVWRRIFGPKRNEVTGGWRKLHNEELRDLYSSPSLIMVIESRRMIWARHVSRMRRRGMHVCYWWKRRFGFHKILGNYRVTTKLMVPRVVLSYIELLT
jgi:hypothetical protein